MLKNQNFFMREFIYFSKKAWTIGSFRDLMKAGRLDIACHFIVHSFFVSNAIRNDVICHLFFYGPPDPPKHIEIYSNASISKKDVSGLIKRALFKYKKGEKIEALQGVFVEKKSLLDFINELKKEGKQIYLLDVKGEDIDKVKIEKNSAFIIGDHEGLPKKERKRLKQLAIPISLGKTVYFASQALIILQYELDKRGI